MAIEPEVTSKDLYKKILSRDEQYDDVFFFAVTSTGIYCRPSCPAKRPSEKNCRFFLTAKTAEENGFRACKRCKPSQSKDASIATFLYEIQAQEQLSSNNAKDWAAALGMSERQLRRLVKHRIGKTPSQLSRLRQLTDARTLLLGTKLSVTSIAFRVDFASVRQFNFAFKQKFGVSPRIMRQQEGRG
jgi:AraC family transcriptional regulator, regulatory protein of adaptative response / DNA-3-methyladenine glycosylase II